MHTTISKPYIHLLIFVLTICSLTFFSVTDSFAQKKGKKSEKHIFLKKDARTNGFTITVQNGEIFFEAVNVTDPKTKKLIEGLRRLLYRCSQNGPEIPVQVTFSNGNSNRALIGCTVLYEPKILLLDAAYPGQ
ncbi:MAG: hypothetical protein SFU87_13180 [Chitinophagaceae bacterium]|nr:hypothetical protein [Chitinophagaceae bacterium]